MDAEFIVKYIAETAAQGKEPLISAKEEITEIDNFLKEAERKKVRRMKLLTILNHFGDETYRRRHKINLPSSEDVGDSDELNNLYSEIIAAIEREGPLSTRNLILKVGSYDQDVLIMRAVKNLGDREIISRDNEGKIKKGKNWCENE